MPKIFVRWARWLFPSSYSGERVELRGKRIKSDREWGSGVSRLCRNIRVLFNFDPPATEEEIRAASLQFVRKISGFSKASRINERSFLVAVDEVARASTRLLRSLETEARAKSREEEAAKAKARSVERFGRTLA